MSESRADTLKRQCANQAERCLYTSTTFLIWLRVLRHLRIGFIIIPIVCGTLAGWDLLKQQPEYGTMTALLALLAGLVPAIYAALKLDEHLPTAARLAGEYKNLEIIFSDLEVAGSTLAIDRFERDYKEAFARLEAANAAAYTTPEWCFRAAQKKIIKGHYRVGDTNDDPPVKVLSEHSKPPTNR